MKWEDATGYGRDEPYSNRKARAWRMALTRDFTIWVGHEHIYYKGLWIAHCTPFFQCRDLNMPADKFTAEQAQAKALDLVRAEVAKINAALDAASFIREAAMKPTPGPWEIDGDSQRIDGIGEVHAYRVLAPSGAVVAEFSNAECNEIVYEDDGEGGGTHCDRQAMANATLIAAAPEMADAIVGLIETYEPYPGGSAWDAYQKAKAALAKARGTCQE